MPSWSSACAAARSLDQAVEVFRGTPQDVGVSPLVLRDSDGRAHGSIAYRSVDIFHRQFILLRPGGNVALPIPQRASPAGIVDGRLLVTLDEAWDAGPRLRFPTDSIVSYDLAEWQRDPNAARPSLVWAPGPRQTLNGIATTHGKLLVAILDNVRGRAFAMDYAGGSWRTTEIALPRNATIGLAASSDRGRAGDVQRHRLSDAVDALSL